jgi:hypothetical protein
MSWNWGGLAETLFLNEDCNGGTEERVGGKCRGLGCDVRTIDAQYNPPDPVARLHAEVPPVGAPRGGHQRAPGTGQAGFGNSMSLNLIQSASWVSQVPKPAFSGVLARFHTHPYLGARSRT